MPARRRKNEAAREVFEAIEQARVEAIGALQMKGVAANLDARPSTSIAASAASTGVTERDACARSARRCACSPARP